MVPFGKNINVKRRNDEPTEKEVFLDILLALEDCWKRTNHLESEVDLGISSYDETFYLIIENLIYIHYGEWKGDLILWWVFERFGENGELLPITIDDENDDEDSESEEVIVTTSEELWDLLKKIELK
jgi:hypothetical protein